MSVIEMPNQPHLTNVVRTYVNIICFACNTPVCKEGKSDKAKLSKHVNSGLSCTKSDRYGHMTNDKKYALYVDGSSIEPMYVMLETSGSGHI